MPGGLGYHRSDIVTLRLSTKLDKVIALIPDNFAKFL